jgi:lauroyl/myristoyl acyltransferase
VIGRPILVSLRILAKHAPRLSFAAAHWLAKVSHGDTVSRDAFATLFPQLSSEDIDDAMRRSWSNLLRSAVVKDLVERYGIAPMRRSVLPSEALGALRAPAILATFHLGPMRALLAGIERLGFETIVVRAETLPHNPRNVVTVKAGDTPESRALAFHTSVTALRAGKFVMLTVEPDLGAHIDVSLFGRPFTLARGTFALARVAQAPIVPMVARWRGMNIEIVLGESIAPSSDEMAMANAVAQWLERYLTDNPSELKPRIMRLFRR